MVAPRHTIPLPVELIIDETVAAAIAAHAAGAVPDVVRLEPGLSGLITHLAAHARDQLRPADSDRAAPTEGVDVDVDGSTARVHLNVVTCGDTQAATVAHQVQSAVAQALKANAGLTATVISVSILDIERPSTSEAADRDRDQL